MLLRTHCVQQPALDFIHDRIAICFVSDLFKNEEDVDDDDGKLFSPILLVGKHILPLSLCVHYYVCE